MEEVKARLDTFARALLSAWEQGVAEERAHAKRLRNCLASTTGNCSKEAASDPLGVGWISSPPNVVAALRARKIELDFAEGGGNSRAKCVSSVLSALSELISADDLNWKVPIGWKEMVNAAGGTQSESNTVRSAMIIGDPRYGALLRSEEMFLGLVWMAENTHYPLHAHEQLETYHVLFGHGSRWFDVCSSSTESGTGSSTGRSTDRGAGSAAVDDKVSANESTGATSSGSAQGVYRTKYPWRGDSETDRSFLFHDKGQSHGMVVGENDMLYVYVASIRKNVERLKTFATRVAVLFMFGTGPTSNQDHSGL